MILEQTFINQSLELNLFFLRIMKEHSIFLEAAFVLKDRVLISQANTFKNQFSNLLSHAITLSDGVIPLNVLDSNEIVTKYTMDAERATQFASGIKIDSNLTAIENSLSSGMIDKDRPFLADKVYELNKHSLATTKMIAKFKTQLKGDILSCKTFTNTYPLLIDHILREALLFGELLTRLQNGIEIDMKRDILDQENFWDEIMSEHAYFIRGLLDPSEVDLFDIANNFGHEFETLRKEASDINNQALNLTELTNNTITSTTKIRDFKMQATEGLLACKIKSIIVPLLADHVLREANHYLYLLNNFKDMKENK